MAEKEGREERKRDGKKNENHIGNVLRAQNQSSYAYIRDASSSRCCDTGLEPLVFSRVNMTHFVKDKWKPYG